MSAPPRLARAGAVVVLVAIGVGVALIGAAMHLYPGGTALDRAHTGHSFWVNYLCDLTNDTAVNGAMNARGAALARGGFLLLSATLGLVWLILPRLLRGGRLSTSIVQGGGVLCALGLIAVPFASGALHAPTILLTVVPGVSALATALIGMWRGRRLALLAVAVAALVASVVDAILYAGKVAGWIASTSPAVPMFQRLAALLLLAWMAGVGASVLRTSRPRPP